jgi:hypothetical protein
VPEFLTAGIMACRWIRAGETRDPEGLPRGSRRDAISKLLALKSTHFDSRGVLFQFETILADALYRRIKSKSRRKQLIYNINVDGTRHNYGKDTLFNGVFESKKST